MSFQACHGLGVVGEALSPDASPSVTTVSLTAIFSKWSLLHTIEVGCAT